MTVVCRCIFGSGSELYRTCQPPGFVDWQPWRVHLPEPHRRLLRAGSCHLRHPCAGETLAWNIRHLGNI